MKVFFIVLAIGVVITFLKNLFRLLATSHYYGKFLTQKQKLKYSGATIDYLWKKRGYIKSLQQGNWPEKMLRSMSWKDHTKA